MRYRSFVVGLAVALAFVAAGCGGKSGGDGGAKGSKDVTGSISVMAIWAGEEQKSFQAVIDGFNEKYPNVTVKYTSGGDNLAPLLSTAVEGGNPPDLAAIGQPGLMADFAKKGAIKPIDNLRDKIVNAFGKAVADASSVNGTQYAVMFKGSNKSTIWYNVASFDEAGVEPPETWDDLNKVRDTLLAAGITPYSVGVDVGWPLSDLFENIYLRTAGPDMYDQLAKHEIPWTDPSVTDALTKMGDIIGNGDLIAGGTSGALQTDFTGSVTQMFADPPDGAMLFEGNFVGGVINGETQSKVGPDADFFEFPSIDGSPPAVMGGGDLAALLKDSEGGKALLEFLATPEAAEVWAGLGGFISPNKNVDISAYTDPIDKRAAQALIDAGDSVRYDMSDLQPTEFGATTGQGEWGIFTDFMSHPDDVDGIAQQLEAAAKAAYK